METININKEVKKPRQKVLDPIKLEEQEVYMDKVRVLNEKWAKKKRRKPTVGLGTFGCQMKRQKVLDPIKLEEQEVYMDKVRVLNEKWAKKKRRKPTVGLGTFGCQMNCYTMKK